MNIVSKYLNAETIKVLNLILLSLFSMLVNAQQSITFAALDDYAPYSWSENG
jgi:hypothetical protein